MNTDDPMMQKLEFMRRSAAHARRQEKQAVWKAMQADLPEFVPTFTALAKRFGVRQVAVAQHGSEWVTWREGK